MVSPFLKKLLDPAITKFARMYLAGAKQQAKDELNKFLLQFNKSKYSKTLWMEYLQNGIEDACGVKLQFVAEKKQDDNNSKGNSGFRQHPGNPTDDPGT